MARTPSPESTHPVSSSAPAEAEGLPAFEIAYLDPNSLLPHPRNWNLCRRSLIDGVFVPESDIIQVWNRKNVSADVGRRSEHLPGTERLGTMPGGMAIQQRWIPSALAARSRSGFESGRSRSSVGHSAGTSAAERLMSFGLTLNATTVKSRSLQSPGNGKDSRCSAPMPALSLIGSSSQTGRSRCSAQGAASLFVSIRPGFGSIRTSTALQPAEPSTSSGETTLPIDQEGEEMPGTDRTGGDSGGRLFCVTTNGASTARSDQRRHGGCMSITSDPSMNSVMITCQPTICST